MGNRLRPFPDTPDWPEWPKWPFWAILAWSKLAKIVTWVQSMLQTWFWCLSPGFWAWEIDWDHFRTHQIDLSGQNGHFGQFWPGLNWPKLQLGFRACYRLDFGVYPEVFGHGKLIESISGCSPPLEPVPLLPVSFLLLAQLAQRTFLYPLAFWHKLTENYCKWSLCFYDNLTILELYRT